MTTEHPAGPARARPRRALLAAPCAWLVVLAACGGGEVGAERQAPLLAPIPYDPTPALLDDEGRAMPTAPGMVPADGAARTRNGRYASARQAEQLEHALGAAVMTVDVECCGLEAAERALGLAYGWQAAHDLAHDAPVLVRAADLRLGAAVANRLLEGGYAHVWLVTR